MPRNVSGTYSLPLPPVVANTVIQSAWANTTTDDIAQGITDSLDRNGRGGMIAPFRLVDGTVLQPAFAFSSETGTGLFKVSAGIMGVSVMGVQVAQWSGTAYSVSTNMDVIGDFNVIGNLGFTGDLIVDGDLLLTQDLQINGGLAVAGGITSLDDIGITENFDGFAGFVVGNASGGGSAAAGFRGTNNTSKQTTLLATGTGYIGIPAASDSGVLYSDTSQGLFFMSALGSSYMRFAAGGIVEQMRLTAGGNLGVGIAAPAVRMHIASTGTTARYRAQSLDAGGSVVEMCADTSTDTYIGSITNHPLLFLTNSGERARFKATGEFGIGCTPFANVWFQTRVGLNQNIGIVSISSGATISSFTDAGSSAPMRIAPNILVISGNGGANDQFWFDNNGNMGIGQTPRAPSVSLDIARPDDARIVLDGTSASSGAGGTILFYRTGAFVGSLGVSANRLGDSSSQLLLQATSDILFDTGGLTERMRIASNGFIGIGKTPTFQIDATFAGQSVFRLGYTGASEIYLQANSSSDVRMGSLTAHPTIVVTNGSQRLTVPINDGAITERVGGVDYIMSVDPGVGPTMPVGSIIFGAATGVTGGALNGLGTSTLGGAVTLTVQAFVGGTASTTNVGTWRNIGAQSSGIGLWQRVA